MRSSVLMVALPGIALLERKLPMDPLFASEGPGPAECLMPLRRQARDSMHRFPRTS